MSKTYDPVGCCIYCGRTADQARMPELQEEHIIASFLGGDLILPEASCKTCAVQTGADEGFCAREMFEAARTLFGWKSRKRRRKKPHKLKAGKTNPDLIDHIALREIPTDEYPPIVILPNLYPPSRLYGVQPETPDRLRGAWNYFGPGWEEKVRKLNDTNTLSITFRLGPFCRMLAKIAHSYATAEMGIGTFHPYLKDIILNKGFQKNDERCADWSVFVGSPPNHTETSREGLHDLQLRNEKGAVVVYIRLYGNGPFTYVVAVGEI